MSKKTKRQTRRTTVVSAPVVSAPTNATPSTPGRMGEFAPDYTYVIKDLRRIGTLAGSFFAILVVLSFFLH